MEMIRFPCMKTSYLENVALKDELVVSVPAWQRLVEDALHLLISAPQGKNKSRIKPRKSPNVLYLIGELSSRIEVFDLDAQCCRPVTNMAQTTGTAVVVNEELHVVLGGGTRIEKYDAKFNSWVQVGNGVKESDFAVCVSMGCIYVVGGGKRAKSFNLATRTWSTLPSMSMRRTFHSAVALQGKIYAVGGLGIPGYQAVASVECFNPASNRWEPVGRMITERHRHESAAMRNKIFVIGGIGCQNNTLTSAEVFDSATNTWSRIASLKYPRRDFGLGVLQDLLFVFGGNGTNTIECYDAIADKWNDVGSLAKRWNSFRCVLCPLYQV